MSVFLKSFSLFGGWARGRVFEKHPTWGLVGRRQTLGETGSGGFPGAMKGDTCRSSIYVSFRLPKLA